MEGAVSRAIRAFTFDINTLARFNELLDGGPESVAIKSLLALPAAPPSTNKAIPVVDRNDLTKEDCAAIYRLLPPSVIPKKEEVPEDWEALLRVLNSGPVLPKHLADLVAQKIRAYQVQNRRNIRKYKTATMRAELNDLRAGTRLNASRVADALLTLGMTALSERITAKQAAGPTPTTTKQASPTATTTKQASPTATTTKQAPSTTTTKTEKANEPTRSPQGPARKARVKLPLRQGR
jgi:hypothetical protein